ncbi:hypothetical protein D3C81_1261110 [compost metagenome]
MLVTRGVQEHVAHQVVDLHQRQGALQQRRCTHGGQLFVEQFAHLQPMVRQAAVHHRCVEAFAAKIHAMLHRGGQLYRYIGAQRLPFHQTRQQPAHHAGRGLELQGGVMPADFPYPLFDQREHLLHPRQPVLAFTRQAQAARLALEQGVTEVLLQCGDLPADGALGDVQLLPGTGEITVLCSDQEGVQGGQGREPFHCAEP